MSIEHTSWRTAIDRSTTARSEGFALHDVADIDVVAKDGTYKIYDQKQQLLRSQLSAEQVDNYLHELGLTPDSGWV
jgi:hypothetical protein